MSSPFYEEIKNWEDVGASATAVGVIVAVVAAIFAYLQYKGAKQIQREATAKQIYSNYLQLAIQYPNFTTGNKPNYPVESERYEWFISYMLNACEQIIDSVGDDKEWRKTVIGQIEYHREYFAGNEGFKAIDYYYDKKIRSMIDEVCGTHK